MQQSRSGKRLLSVVLSAVLTLSALPAGVHAQQPGTLAGEPQTVELRRNEAGERENNLNRGWKFALGDHKSAQNPGFNDSRWETVNLPHDFSISQNFTTSGEAESGFLPGGTGWYRKSFPLQEELADKTFLLNFDGVYSDAYVYVNGTYVGEHHYGYTPFAFDISDYLIFDGATENVIAVKAVNNLPTSRWYSGSGIYRDVTLIVTEPVHVDLHGTYVTTPDIEQGTGTVRAEVQVANDGAAAAAVTVVNRITRKGSDQVLAEASAQVQIPGGETRTVTASPVVAQPQLWSVEDPNLYVMHTEIQANGKVTDSYETSFGFRYQRFDREGFHLNGKNVKLNGVCLHHDQGALGSAASYDAMYRQLSIMKDMGVNAIRTSHNPADEQFIEICSELGLLVIEEAFDGWHEPKNYNSNDFSQYFEAAISPNNGLYGAEPSMTWAEYTVKAMVRRDRSQPCIIAWSMGNEIQEGTTRPDMSGYPRLVPQIIGWIQELDSTRPTTTGDNNRGGDGNLVQVINTITANGGIAGFNYANSASSLRDLANRFGGPMGCIIASETASATNSRGIYTSQSSNTGVDGKRHLTSYDTSAVPWGITAHESIYNTYQNDNVAGEFVWTGFDYIGEPTPYNGQSTGQVIGGYGSTPNSAYFGIVETTGFPKDTFYLYRSQWNHAAPTLHLVTAWDADNQMTDWNGRTPVWVYSNAPKVELYRDNVLMGTAIRQSHTSAAGHTYFTYSTSSSSTDCATSSGSGSDGLYAVFNVRYQPGTLSAIAYDEAGHPIDPKLLSGQTKVTTPGAPAELRISANRETMAADGDSLAYITVDVTDAKGNFDTTASNLIRFSLAGNGEIAGVDNGDQATNDKYQQPSVLKSPTEAQIRAYAGKALVIVRSTEDAGPITLNIRADGLTGGSVTLTTTPAADSGSTGLASYTMVRDYTVRIGTEPQLGTEASGLLADGTVLHGSVAWEPIPQTIWQTAGDHTLSGVLTLPGQKPVPVSGRLHVIDNVIALRNLSAAVIAGGVPALPATVPGILADGTLSGEFAVDWEPVDESMFRNPGELVTVSGSARIFGDETLPVTASVRAAEAVSTESVNLSPIASRLEQDIEPGRQSDNLESIRNGNRKPGDNTRERWSNWNNRTRSDRAALTFRWDTVQMIGSVSLYYYYDNCAAKPANVEIRYSGDGSSFETIACTEELVEDYGIGAHYRYTFEKPVNPVALQIVLTQQGGTSGSHCVALTEAEVLSYAGRLEVHSSAALSAITADGAEIEAFAPDTLAYEAAGSRVEARTQVNAGITVLPAFENVVRILTVAEDGSDRRTYEVRLTAECPHTQTELRGERKPTCTEGGYSGDRYCTVCGALVEEGHDLAPLGHDWDEGTVTKQPTASEPGVRTFTCRRCGETRTEEIPPLAQEKQIPRVTLQIDDDGRDLVMSARIEDFGHPEKYHTVTAQGILFINKGRMQTSSLNIHTYARSEVPFDETQPDGSFVYTLKKPSRYTTYVVRAYVAYTDPATGRTEYAYSDMCTGSVYSLSRR